MYYQSPVTDYLVKSTYRKYIFAVPISGSELVLPQLFRIRNAGDYVNIVFRVGGDLSALTGLSIHYVALATQNLNRITIGTGANSEGELSTANSTTTTDTPMPDQVNGFQYMLDISGMIGTVSADDIIRVSAIFSAAGNGTDIEFTGVLATYEI